MSSPEPKLLLPDNLKHVLVVLKIEIPLNSFLCMFRKTDFNPVKEITVLMIYIAENQFEKTCFLREKNENLASTMENCTWDEEDFTTVMAALDAFRPVN